jgi:hypothetical protein
MMRPEVRERLREIRIGELRRLSEEGQASGLSDESGEAFLDRLEAKYQAMATSGRAHPFTSQQTN